MVEIIVTEQANCININKFPLRREAFGTGAFENILTIK
jgi:hypothetical protein